MRNRTALIPLLVASRGEGLAAVASIAAFAHPVPMIRRVRCATLLVHGGEDAAVPADEARQIHAARSGEHVRPRIIAGSQDDFGNGSDIAGEIAEAVGFLLGNSDFER